jgi:predicted nucleic acid-binding protein
MRIADTSALYALFSQNDVHHEEAINEMENPEPILIPSEIWSETISLIHYRQGFDMAVRAGKTLLQLPHVDIVSSRMDIVRSSWDMYQKTKGNLSVPDCVVLKWCSDKDAAPLTFDNAMKKYFEETSYFL